MARQTDEQRADMMADFDAGMSQANLAINYQVSLATVNKHCKGRIPANKPLYATLQESAYNSASDGYIYIAYIDDSNSSRFYKIGLARNVDARIKQHQTSIPFDLKIAMSFYVSNMKQKEMELHVLFSSKNVRGEWYLLDNDDLEIIKKGIIVYG